MITATLAACPQAQMIIWMMWAGAGLGFIGLSILAVRAKHHEKLGGWRQLLARLCWLAAAGCISASSLFDIRAPRDSCGSRVGWQATAALWLFTAAIGLVVLAISLPRKRIGWPLLTALGFADLGFMVMLQADRQQQDRFGIAVLFSVHAISSFIAAYWAWRLLVASNVRYVKATEAGRLLAGGWLAVALLGLSSIQSRDLHLVSDSALVGIIALGAATGILGTGYSKYVEARDGSDAPVAMPQLVSQPSPARTATDVARPFASQAGYATLIVLSVAAVGLLQRRSRSELRRDPRSLRNPE